MTLEWINELTRQELEEEKRDFKTQFETGIRSCDKGDHKERSIIYQPNHKKHWKKVGYGKGGDSK